MARFDWDSYIRKSAGMIYFRVASDGTIAAANEGACKASKASVVGMPISDYFVHANQQDITFKTIHDWCNSHVSLSVNVVNSMPQTYRFFFQENGEFVDVVGELDYPESEHMRTVLMETNASMNDLTRQLYKSNAELKRLSAFKDRFLGMAAHDLRTPAGNMGSLAELVLSDCENTIPEKSKRFLQTICDLSKSMISLLTELLDISAIESGNLNLNCQRGDIAEAINDAIQLNRLQAEKKNITIQFTRGLPVSVLHDRMKLGQVFNNMISNALKYSHPATTVTIQVEPGDNSALIRVTDQGQGIPEGEIGKLFKSFSRTSVKTTGGETSTGLGLLIARRIVEAHQGRIWLESQVGRGTTVFVWLPNEDRNTGESNE